MTKRQEQISSLVRQGLSRSQIAEQLGISVRTVEGYIYQSRKRAHPGVLTEREQEVADLVKRGLSNADIANVLGIAKRTVESHRFKIVGRLGLGTSARLTAQLNEELIATLRTRIAELEEVVSRQNAELAKLKHQR